MSLTEKQLRFIEEYLIDSNATQAAIRAGYSEKTAYSQGQRLLKNVEVARELERRQKELAKTIRMTQEDVLANFEKVANGDIGDYVEYRTELLQVGTTKEGVTIYEYRPIVIFKDQKTVDTSLIKEISLSAKGNLKIVLHDAMDANAQIARIKGMYNDNLTVNADLTHKTIFNGVEDGTFEKLGSYLNSILKESEYSDNSKVGGSHSQGDSVGGDVVEK